MFTQRIVLEGQALRHLTGYQMPRRGLQLGISVALKKRLNAHIALGLEHGACAIKQATPRYQQRPKGLQDLLLESSQLLTVLRAAQPAHVRVASDNP